MGTGVGLRQVGYFDCAGGGQVVVVDGIAYIGNMRNPHGTLDHRREGPEEPQGARQDRHAARHAFAQGARGGRHHGDQPRDQRRRSRGPVPPDFQGGLGIYDVSDPGQARARSRAGPRCGKGVHRFDFDGRYAYISPTLDGYVGNIVMILDLKDPASPQEVGRWWMPGQWTAGGETPTWKGPRIAAIIRCASATASTPATGRAASSSSTSTT